MLPATPEQGSSFAGLCYTGLQIAQGRSHGAAQMPMRHPRLLYSLSINSTVTGSSDGNTRSAPEKSLSAVCELGTAMQRLRVRQQVIEINSRPSFRLAKYRAPAAHRC